MTADIQLVDSDLEVSPGRPQAVYCRDELGIDPDRFDVNGNAISIGHPDGMTGARLVGHALNEGQRRGVRFVVISVHVGGGMGAAGRFGVA